MQRLTFRHTVHMYGRIYTFSLNKVSFAVLDVSSLPLQNCQTSLKVFFTLIDIAILFTCPSVRSPCSGISGV